MSRTEVTALGPFFFNSLYIETGLLQGVQQTENGGQALRCHPVDRGIVAHRVGKVPDLVGIGVAFGELEGVAFSGILPSRQNPPVSLVYRQAVIIVNSHRFLELKTEPHAERDRGSVPGGVGR